VSLTAVDTGSGVAVTMIKIDDGDWANYTVPIVVTMEAAHTVSFYSVDKMGNTEEMKSTSFTIWKEPVFEVKVRGGLGVTMKITNVGPTNLSRVQWSLTLEGKHVYSGNVGGFITSLDMGKSVSERMPVFGFGKVIVKATVGPYDFNATGMLFLFAIVGVK
jgi:hypothetical protein